MSKHDSPKPEYKVIKSDNFKTFSAVCRAQLVLGYKPTGGVCVENGVYYQAFVKSYD